MVLWKMIIALAFFTKPAFETNISIVLLSPDATNKTARRPSYCSSSCHNSGHTLYHRLKASEERSYLALHWTAPAFDFFGE